MNLKPKVSVVMITYAHEKYIKQAVEGVLMQEYTGEIELIIANDNSPDQSHHIITDIINNHTNGEWIRYTKHAKNKGMIPNFIWTLRQATGEYVAICEGDDFWNDKLKIQKQVNLLESQKNIGLVCTHRANFYQKSNQLKRPVFNENCTFTQYSFYDVFCGKIQIATLTTLFRKELLEKYLSFYSINEGRVSGLDFCLWTFLAYQKDVALMHFESAVYRILENSATHGSYSKKWELKKRYYNDFKFYIKYLENLDVTITSATEYDRAKGYYVMALRAKDYEICSDFVVIFRKNKDFTRLYLLKLVLQIRILRILPIFFETLKNKL